MFPLNFTTFSHKICPNEFHQHFHNHRHWHRHLPTDQHIIPETFRPGRSLSPLFVVIMSRVVHLNFSFIEEKSLPRIWNGPYCRRSRQAESRKTQRRRREIWHPHTMMTRCCLECCCGFHKLLLVVEQTLWYDKDVIHIIIINHRQYGRL